MPGAELLVWFGIASFFLINIFPLFQEYFVLFVLLYLYRQ